MAQSGRYVEVSGHRHWVIEAGNGRPLMLLHGGFDNSEAFFAAIGERLSSGRRVIAYDRIGHGRTADRPAPFHYASMAEQTAAVIGALGLEAVDVCGWSDGGIVALAMALSQARLLRRMVLIGANSHYDVIAPGLLDPQAPWLDGVRAKFIEQSPDDPSHFPQHVRKTFALWAGEPTFKPEELATIATPALVLNGDRDDLIPLAHTMRLFEAIPGAQLAIVPDATHFVAAEKPAITAALIEAFLDA